MAKINTRAFDALRYSDEHFMPRYAPSTGCIDATEPIASHCLFGCCECTRSCCSNVCSLVLEICQSEDVTIADLIKFHNNGIKLDFKAISENMNLTITALLWAAPQLPLDSTSISLRPDLTPDLIEKYRYTCLPSGKSVFDWGILAAHMDEYVSNEVNFCICC